MPKPKIKLGLTAKTAAKLKAKQKPTTQQIETVSEYYRIPRSYLFARYDMVDPKPVGMRAGPGSDGFTMMSFPTNVPELLKMMAEEKHLAAKLTATQQAEDLAWTIRDHTGGSLMLELHGELTPGSCGTVAKAIAAQHGRQIHFAICSHGGRIDQMKLITDAMAQAKRQGCSLIGRTAGYCQSSALTILLCCDERSAAPGTEMLLHCCSGAKDPEYAGHIDSMADTDAEVASLISSHTGIDSNRVHVLMDSDTLFSPDSSTARELCIVEKKPFSELAKRKQKLEQMRLNSLELARQREEQAKQDRLDAERERKAQYGWRDTVKDGRIVRTYVPDPQRQAALV